MRTYTWTGADHKGRYSDGEVKAPCLADAERLIRADGISPYTISEPIRGRDPLAGNARTYRPALTVGEAGLVPLGESGRIGPALASVGGALIAGALWPGAAIGLAIVASGAVLTLSAWRWAFGGSAAWDRATERLGALAQRLGF